jgi:hypothetical protein
MPRYKIYTNRLPDKRITVQVVRHNAGWTVQTVVDSAPATLNAQRTVQQAVWALYPLPGQSHTVTLRRGTADVDHMWWPWPGGQEYFQQDWYPRIQDGDVVEIAILFDEDQEVHLGPGERCCQWDVSGPAPASYTPPAHARGPHHARCRCVPCNLAALLSFR